MNLPVFITEKNEAKKKNIGIPFLKNTTGKESGLCLMMRKLSKQFPISLPDNVKSKEDL